MYVIHVIRISTQMNLNQAGSPITLHTTENASDTVITINQN